MNKKISKALASLFVSALAVVGLAAPASATADPTINTLPSFTLSGSTISSYVAGTWNQGTTNAYTQTIDQAYACMSSHTATDRMNTSFRNQIGGPPLDCQPLWTDSGASSPFTSGDLSTAHIGNTVTSPYDSTTQPYVVIVTMAQTASMWYSYATSSQQITAPAPTVLTAPAVLGISNDVVTVTHGTWDSLDSQDSIFFACPATTSAETVPYDGSNDPLVLLCVEVAVNTPGPLNRSTTSYNVADFMLNMNSWVPYASYRATFPHLVIQAMLWAQPSQLMVHSASLNIASSSNNPPSANTSADVSRPYTGPIIQTPQISGPAAPGGKLTLPGNNLETVSSVEIGGESASVEFNENGDLEIVVPKDLAPGTYDLVVVSDFGRLTIQDAITVTSAEEKTSTGEARPSMKRGDDDTVKVRVFDVVNAGKVQIFVNDREIVWIRADDFDDPRLTAFGYLVRTVALQPGKNVIEVYVDGERVDRKAYTLFGSNSSNN